MQYLIATLIVSEALLQIGRLYQLATGNIAQNTRVTVAIDVFINGVLMVWMGVVLVMRGA